MTIEEIKALDADGITARAAEIETAYTAEGANLEELSAELDALEERKKELKELAEKRDAEERAALEATNAKKIIEEKENKKMFTKESTEYRNAFYNYITGRATAEERAILQTPISVDGDGSNDGYAIAIPQTLDEKIWDNVHTAHPVLADINRIDSGIVMQVTKHTAITAGKAVGKKDGKANASASVATEQNTFVKVNLIGKDYVKYVELTYAEAKMSQGALEDYLAEEIASDIGEALAKDVFTQMITDGAANAAYKDSNDYFTTIASALATVTGAVKPVIYCNAATYYGIFGSVDDNGQPVFRDGVAIGAEVKIDSAVPSTVLAVVVDPSKFILNVVQDVMIESDKDIKEHRICVSGYARAEGCMRDNRAAGFIGATTPVGG